MLLRPRTSEFFSQFDSSLVEIDKLLFTCMSIILSAKSRDPPTSSRAMQRARLTFYLEAWLEIWGRRLLRLAGQQFFEIFTPLGLPRFR